MGELDEILRKRIEKLENEVYWWRFISWIVIGVGVLLLIWILLVR